MAKEHLQDSNAHDTLVKKYAHVRFKINHHLQSKPTRIYELSELCSLAASGKLNPNDKVWDSLSCTQRTAEDLNFLSKYYDPRSDVVGQESERSESSGQLSTILFRTFLVLFVTPIVVTPILFALYGTGFFAKTEQNDLTVATKPSPETKPTTPRSTKPKPEPQDDVGQKEWDAIHSVKDADYWVSEIQNELTKKLGRSVSRQEATREYNERREGVWEWDAIHGVKEADKWVSEIQNELTNKLGRSVSREEATREYNKRREGVSERRENLRYHEEKDIETLVCLGVCVFFVLLFINFLPGKPYGRIPYYSFWIFLFGIVGLVLYMKLFPN
jgi:hypothetical protein